jgi:hypothetical protein
MFPSPPNSVNDAQIVERSAWPCAACTTQPWERRPQATQRKNIAPLTQQTE